MNKLENTLVYLAGPIEAAKDFGYGWRDTVTNFFKSRNIKVLDPCHKQFLKDIKETDSANAELQKWRETGEYDKISERMKEIRIYDLKLVDICDFVFIYLDKDTPTCGTWEELFWANRLKKSIFIVYKQGKKAIPLWLYGTIPHKYFYDSIEDALDMIAKIDDEKVEIDSERWKLFRKDFVR